VSDKKLTSEQMVIELLRVLYPEKVVMAETIVFAFGPRELKPEPPSLEQEIEDLLVCNCLEEIRQLEAEIDLVDESLGGWNNVLNEARGRIWVDDIVAEIRCTRILSRLESLLAEARSGMKTEVEK